MTDYIHIRNWDKFQHRDVARAERPPRWIRVYTELLSDEAFLGLSEHRRLILVCVWLEYARTRARLPLDTRSLSRRLQLRVTTADLEALNHAGFIHFSASNVQADGKPDASLEERRGDKTRAVTYIEDQRAKRANGPGAKDFTDLLKEMPA